MGAAGHGRGHQGSCGALSRAARVVPAIPTFSVDKGFWYSIPESLDDRVAIGSIVRAPLSGRKVRGYVVEIGDRHQGSLKEISAVSGDAPVFGEVLRDSLQWAALHYVAPLAVLLERAAPPNLPRHTGAREVTTIEPGAAGDGPFMELARSATAEKRRPITALVGRWATDDWLGAVGFLLQAEATVVVIVATALEAGGLVERARARYGERVVGVSGDNPKELTEAWVSAQMTGSLIIGTPRVAAWHLPGLRLALVLEEGRRAMKDRQTPTLHVRELMSHRHRIEGFTLAFVGPTPSLEVLATGAEVIRQQGRAWPLVEVVDRSGEPPGAGFVSDQVGAALRAVSADGGRSFVFTHRRLADASMRCTTCRRVRRCVHCGSRLGRVDSCPRCDQPAGTCGNCGGDAFEEMGTEPERLARDINRRLGSGTAGVFPTALPIAVGTERDLVSLRAQALVIAADADGLALGHNYRAGEEALRVLARLAGTLGEGPGKRMMVQTSMAGSELLNTLRRGDPMPYLEHLLVERARDGLPPSSEVMAVEVRGPSKPAEIAADLAKLTDASLLGPVVRGSTFRWLMQGPLGAAKLELRPLVQKWRDSGSTVRVDVDPIDL